MPPKGKLSRAGRSRGFPARRRNHLSTSSPHLTPTPAPERFAPMAGGRLMMTNPDRSKCSTRRSGDDARHDLPAVPNPLSATVAQREGERLGEVVGRGGREVDGLGHAPTKKERGAQKKSPCVPLGKERTRAI